MELSSRNAIVSLLITFILVSSAIVVLAAYPPQLKDHGIYEEHGTILISGDSEFTSENGVTGGSGSADDPFLIEGWYIPCADKVGIHIVDASAHVTIRDVWVERERLPDDSSQPQGGVVLRDCGSVRIENSIIDTYRSDGIVASSSSSEESYVTITNCVFDGCSAGIEADHIARLEVTGSYFDFNRECALNLSDCDEISITRNSVIDYPTLGMEISNCTSSSITENAFIAYSNYFDAYDKNSVALRDSRSVNISCNTFGDWQSDGAQHSVSVLRSVFVNVTDNWSHGDQWMFFKDSSQCDVSRNYFHYGEQVRVELENTTDCTVSGNHVDSGGVFSLSEARRCSIDSNIIEDYYFGGHINIHGEDLVVANNVLIGRDMNIWVEGKDIAVVGNTIRDGLNWFEDYKHVFHARDVTNLTLSGNAMLNNSGVVPSWRHPFSIQNSSNVTIENNRMSDSMAFYHVTDIMMRQNDVDGPVRMEFWDDSEMQDNASVIIHNNFDDVEVEFLSMQVIIWDEGYPEGGNYWSAYNGTDELSGAYQNVIGSDGIGDEPFQIDLDNIDYYPLMQPVVLEDTTSPVTFSMKDGEFGKRGWFLSDVNLSLESWDATSQVSTTSYRLDDGPWTEYTSPIKVSGDGIHSIEYFSADEEGNEEAPVSEVLRIDTVAPTLETSLPESIRFKDVAITSITVPFTDSGSGICYYSWTDSDYPDYYPYVDVNPFPGPTLELLLSEFIHALIVTCTDFAGNIARVETAIDASINEDRDPLSTTGPYGPFVLVALVLDIAVGLVLWHAIGDAIREKRGGNPPKPEQKYDKDDVMDGHELYHRAR